MLQTKIDRLMELLEKEKRVSLESLAKKLDWNIDSVERAAKVLESKGLVENIYPINVLQKPSVALRKTLPSPKPLPPLEERQLSSYTLSSDGVQANV